MMTRRSLFAILAGGVAGLAGVLAARTARHEQWRISGAWYGPYKVRFVKNAKPKSFGELVKQTEDGIVEFYDPETGLSTFYIPAPPV